MIVDAWRLSHLIDPDSTMIYLRNLVNSGQAVTFAANVQTPTVTMPRIKALTGGVVPSLISLVTNFFASENVEDNWITSAAAAGRRITFFGDDTWLRLFPKAFTEAEGVTSFFVNDYTEVDNNVTRRLDRVLTTDSWDLLILHYLGLDHIGHSLGGESPQIVKKLSEMDSIARRIINDVSARSPLLFIVVADHGMTAAGSHGGGSEAESRVPMLFFHSKTNVIKKGNLGELMSVEQIDLASTLPFFLGTNIPSGSIGLSLIPLLARYWKLSDSTIFSAAVQSHIHFSRFITDHALHRLASVEDSRRCEAAKAFVFHAKNPSTVERSRKVQRKIIQSEEEILHWPVFVGLALIFFTFLFSTVLQQSSTSTSPQDTVGATDHSAYLVFALYHISSYSTSLIEEEHDIWYYISSTLVLLRIFPNVMWRLGSLNFLQMVNSHSKVMDEFFLLCLHRLAISFTMSTRRRWSMRSGKSWLFGILISEKFTYCLDVLPPQIFPEFRFGISILDSISTDINISALCRSIPIITTALCTTYIVFRLQFKSTKYGWLVPITYFLPIIICCRLLTDDQCRWMTYIILIGCALGAIMSFSFGLMLYMSYLVRPETLPLLLICFEMGVLADRATFSPFLFAFLCQTVFFYPGLSSNISSIDIAIGYKGLSSYVPTFVLIQILINFYATPIAFALGYS
ncbi:hypothetical protein DICVIV_08640 [Dictyocaulus viviparus]|uniref:Uncharacterized protein n=1 Tax=Dictyocaulus viviparus TaxID=29172 RepID=A0A0D8XL31_DICVI|nr:hypothetical protein DICVIV_08640 [Dictyocaulus viviparus]